MNFKPTTSFKPTTINNLIDYAMNHHGEEIVFVADPERCWGPGSGWYAVKYDTLFYGPIFFIGELWCAPAIVLAGEEDLTWDKETQRENIIECFIDFFSTEFAGITSIKTGDNMVYVNTNFYTQL